MLGLGDIWVFLAYVLCIISAIGCFIYGFIKWNDDGEIDDESKIHWVDEEIKLEKSL